MVDKERRVFLRLYYNSIEGALTTPANNGIADAFPLVKEVEKKGVTCEWIDTSKLSEGGRRHAYFDAVAPSVLHKYKIRQIFGSLRHSGWLFGKGVPALMVIDPEKQYPDDVYLRSEGGRLVTINDFLGDLLTRQD